MEIKRAQEKHIKLAKKLIKNLKKERIFLVEGENLVNIAILNNLKPLYIFVTEKFVKNNINFVEAHSGYRDNFLITREKTLSSLSMLETHRNILGFFKFRENHRFIKSKLPLTVALDGIQDPANFGAILRSALLFGVEKIITSERNVSIYNPKVVRGSMGAVFYMKVKEHRDLMEEILNHRDNGYKIYISDATKGKPLKNIEKKLPALLIFGNEGRGVRDEIKNLANLWLRIETTEILNSLSVSTAVGITLYSFFISNT